MKKTIALLTLAIAAWLPAQADEVTSVNAVGIVRVIVNKGELSLLSLPFNTFDEETKVQDIFGDLPNGTRVHFWIDNEWVTLLKSRGSWPANNINITRTMGLFVEIPNNAQELQYEIVFSGEVPSSFNAETTVIALDSGLTLSTFPYPTEKTIDEAGL